MKLRDLLSHIDMSTHIMTKFKKKMHYQVEKYCNGLSQICSWEVFLKSKFDLPGPWIEKYFLYESSLNRYQQSFVLAIFQGQNHVLRPNKRDPRSIFSPKNGCYLWSTFFQPCGTVPGICFHETKVLLYSFKVWLV